MEIFPVERVANICILTLTVATATAFNWLAFAVFVYDDGGGWTDELRKSSTPFTVGGLTRSLGGCYGEKKRISPPV